MSASKVVQLKVVWDILDRCAPGHSRELKKHGWRIVYAAFVYPVFAKGKHAKGMNPKRNNPEVFAGELRQLARLFEIEDCVRDALPEIF